MRARLPGVAALTCAALVLTACGAGGDDAPPSATAGASGVQVEVGNTINYGSFGTTVGLDCADGKSLTVGGSNNTLTVGGRCASVNVGGADNKVTLNAVDGDLNVIGLNNTVTYSDGDPAVKDTGSGNTIRRG